MARIFLVDSENIGSTWIQLLPVVSGEDKLFVFYTDNSPHVSYEHLLQVIAYHNIPVFLKCHEGRNALDFQLVSELGFLISQYQDAEFVIISDDYGYDAVVKYWTDKKYKIRRINKRYCRPQTFQQREENVFVNNLRDDETADTTGAAFETSDQAVDEQAPVTEPADQAADVEQAPASEPADQAADVTVDEAVAAEVAVTESADQAADVTVDEAAAEDTVTEPADQAADVTVDEAAAVEDAVTEPADQAADVTVDEAVAVEDTVTEPADQAADVAIDEAVAVEDTVTEPADQAADVAIDEAVAVEDAVTEPADQAADVAIDEAAAVEDAVTEPADQVADVTVDEAVAVEDTVTEPADQAADVAIDEAVAVEDAVTEPADQAADVTVDAAATEDSAYETVGEAAEENREEPKATPENKGIPEPKTPAKKESSRKTSRNSKKTRSSKKDPDIQKQILAIVEKCGSEQVKLDAETVKDMFCTMKMDNLTLINTALKIMIGNEVGNDIYRELKENQDCRALLDALYIPTQKERFMHYVKIVLSRSDRTDFSAEEVGEFLYATSRKNLNSLRSAMLKQYGHDKGSDLYTLYKSHIKVLNKI